MAADFYNGGELTEVLVGLYIRLTALTPVTVDSYFWCPLSVVPVSGARGGIDKEDVFLAVLAGIV